MEKKAIRYAIAHIIKPIETDMQSDEVLFEGYFSDDEGGADCIVRVDNVQWEIWYANNPEAENFSFEDWESFYFLDGTWYFRVRIEHINAM